MAKEQEKSLAYFIHGLDVSKLWGYRDLKLTFNKDINILIGPNASGKTTILNLLRYVLTVDLPNLNEMAFDNLSIHLQSFDDRSKRTIKVTSSEGKLKFTGYQWSFDIDMESIDIRRPYLRGRHFAVVEKVKALTELLRDLVPAVWLPVSRRLPIPEEEEEERVYRRERYSRLESVDVRLRELLEELSRYRLSLDAKLSKRYKEFEKQVLQMILYSKQHDRIESLSVAPPTQEDKDQLLRAFEVAGLLDQQTRTRIDEQFSAADEAVNRIAKSEGGKEALHLADLFVIPLIGRTKSMVELSRQLEEDRMLLFEPLHRYEEIVNSFLSGEYGKVVRVEENGELRIATPSLNQDLEWRLLSSGEKQLLILLTQALLWEDRPVVYVADEPELSLHVTWQEKLLSSLRDLGGRIQIIVATHSPDIVGPFADRVIDLGSKL